MANGYTPLPNPPPPDSPWAAVEASRKKLDWSARQLSRAAMGEKSQAHYTQLSRRDWNAEHQTLESFIKALVDAGIPETELRARPRSGNHTDAIRDEAIELLVKKGYRLRQAEYYVSWIEHEPPRGPGQSKPTAARMAALAAALIDTDGKLGDAPDPKLGLDRGPGDKGKRK